MSAVVCGKRSFFDELQSPSPTSVSTPAAKRLRCSPIRFSPASPPPPPPAPSPLDQLRDHFPCMNIEILEEVMETCCNDLDAAIKRMYELCIGSAEGNPASAVTENSSVANGAAPTHEEDAAPSEVPFAHENNPAEGAEWVELVVSEMKNATTMDDARSRAARVLQSFEKFVSSRSVVDDQNFQKENMMLKEQTEVVLRENAILKRAVAIQHERQKEYDDRVREVQQLKQLVVQYQEQMRTLEVNNYALSMHLRQAQQSNSITGPFNPDVF